VSGFRESTTPQVAESQTSVDEPSQHLDERQLVAQVRRIYAAGPPLSWHQTLTTVYRPRYAPFDLILPWIARGARMLDVGCGTGALLLLAGSLACLEKGYGYDSKKSSLDVARAASRDANVEFVESDTVPPEVIRDCSVITLVDVLHHVPADQKLPLLAQIFDNTSPGAVVIIKDLDTKPRWRALANRVTDFLSTRSRVDYMSSSRLRETVRRHGLEILESRRWNRQVWSHYLVVVRRPSS